MSNDKTEKATPKRQDDAREKGQVARSVDLTGAAVVLAGVMALALFGTTIVEGLMASMRTTLGLVGRPEELTGPALGTVVEDAGVAALTAVMPVAGMCLLAAVLANIAQVRFRLTPKALKPDPKRLNPIQGAKNIFGINALFEGVKAVAKIAAVGAVVAAAVLPEIPQLAELVGLPPHDLMDLAAADVLSMAQRAAVVYLVIGVIDLIYQRHRFQKQLRMDHSEIKRENKDQNTPPEVRAAMRRRAMQAGRARMMAAVPDADVVVVNPTHFAVALRYERGMDAPEVVAKGQDLVALSIRRIAEEHRVPIVPDAPLARSLHATVEVGRPIPEELFAAVAQVLAFVYRTAKRRAV